LYRKDQIDENLKVGVVGGGLMGGVTQICTQSSFEMVVREVSQKPLYKDMAGIANWLTKDVAKGRLPSEVKDQTLSRTRPTTALNTFDGCQVVIEAKEKTL
jgi:3-hydroxybutyryl-CoA dehydrogenase